MHLAPLLMTILLPPSDGVQLLTSHVHEDVYIWIKNHSSDEVRTLEVRIEGTGYNEQHVLWTATDTPIPPGKLKQARLNIAQFKTIKRKDIRAEIISVNGVVRKKKEVPIPKHARPKRVAVYLDRVLDGDTVQVHRKDGALFKLRLQGIDAPESDQPYGLEATRMLRRLTIGRILQAELNGKDRYERTLGTLYSRDGKSISQTLLEEGLAWHYLKYSKSAELARSEKLAKDAKRGVWSLPDRIAPWDFRNGVRAATKAPVNAPSTRTTGPTVYITATGEKYHRGSCRYLKKSKIPIPLSRARSAYEACRVCNP